MLAIKAAMLIEEAYHGELMREDENAVRSSKVFFALIRSNTLGGRITGKRAAAH